MENTADFNPYQQPYKPSYQHQQYPSQSSRITEDIEKYDSSPPPQQRDSILPPKVDLAASPAPSPSRDDNFYWTISSILGFREKWSLLFFFVCGGAMLGFCLSRLEMFPPSALEHKTTPGEWFWYRQKLYKPNLLVHVYLTTIAGILSGTQFIPAFRRRNRILIHRINGYVVILLLIPGLITGAIVARHSMGGDVNTQGAFYVLTFMIIGALLMGYRNVGNTPVHRRWMLRAVFYLGSVITGRIVKLIATEIVSSIGTFFSVWSCAEIAFLVGDNSTEYKTGYPECVNPYVHTAVKASLNAAPINFGSAVRTTFGMALWIGMIIHAIGIEFYLLATENP